MDFKERKKQSFASFHAENLVKNTTFVSFTPLNFFTLSYRWFALFLFPMQIC